VAIVRGEAELALSRPERDGDEYRAALRTVGQEGRRLTQIVNDLFLLARAEAGDRPLRATPLYLEELVGDCVNSVRTLAAGRRITLVFSPEAELPFTGDEKLLRRLVVNLLDNAIKYTPEGGRVTVELHRLGEGASAVARITVRDSGPGIPEEARARVFERFYRVRTGDDGGVGDGSGAGLGLPIAAWIAQAHGGQVTILETGAGGTTFAVDLPPTPHDAPLG
jgi:signal transduction histidine kinase